MGQEERGGRTALAGSRLLGGQARRAGGERGWGGMFCQALAKMELAQRGLRCDVPEITAAALRHVV